MCVIYTGDCSCGSRYINHYFTWAVISNAPKNANTGNILEASYSALWKPDLSKQKDFERLVLLRNGVTHIAINDIMQTPKKKVHFFFLSFFIYFIYFFFFNCFWQLMFEKKQKCCGKHIYLLTDDGLYVQKAFHKAKIVFYSSFMNDGEFINYTDYIISE